MGNRYFRTALPKAARPNFGDSIREHRLDRTVDNWTRRTAGRVYVLFIFVDVFGINRRKWLV